MTWELLSEHASFGGEQRFHRHASAQIGLPRRFALYLPPQALAGAKVPLLVFLAGLTGTEDRHTGYDHGYYFIASFVEDHLRHHARHLAD